MFMNWVVVFHAKQFEFYEENENISVSVAFFSTWVELQKLTFFFPGFSKIFDVVLA